MTVRFLAEFVDAWPETTGWRPAYKEVVAALGDPIDSSPDLGIVLRFVGRPESHDQAVRPTFAGIRSTARLAQRRSVLLGPPPDNARGVVAQEVLRLLRSATETKATVDYDRALALLAPVTSARND